MGSEQMRKWYLIGIVLAIILFSTSIVSCKKASLPPTGSVAGSLIQTDGIITGEIKVIKSMTTSYSWAIDVLIKTSQNVGDLQNPVADKVGQVVRFRTDENADSLKVGQTINAHVKLTRGVELGTTLYIYSIQ